MFRLKCTIIMCGYYFTIVILFIRHISTRFWGHLQEVNISMVSSTGSEHQFETDTCPRSNLIIVK
jgi:hypothetical protein